MRKANVLRAGFGLAIVIGLLLGDAGSSEKPRATEAMPAALLVVAAAMDDGAPMEVEAGSKADHRDPDGGCPRTAADRH